MFGTNAQKGDLLSLKNNGPLFQHEHITVRVVLLWAIKLNTTSTMTIGTGTLIQILITQMTHHLIGLLSYRE